ncbi:hypothetical protein ACIPSA_15010 [Streptomyces sp. NPDC086549]|uniref:hypothetical protein n=1 Tax=Streptomyces sp. NPDC086549 TaxID=3365752 RepID=UPI00380881C1
MIQQISHPVADNNPAGFTLALQVAYELHAPAAPPQEPEWPVRAPEVSAPQMMGLRMPAARPHLHKVPLRRLTAVRG